MIYPTYPPNQKKLDQGNLQMNTNETSKSDNSSYISNSTISKKLNLSLDSHKNQLLDKIITTAIFLWTLDF